MTRCPFQADPVGRVSKKPNFRVLHPLHDIVTVNDLDLEYQDKRSENIRLLRHASTAHPKGCYRF
jgi:hypothetical protein